MLPLLTHLFAHWSIPFSSLHESHEVCAKSGSIILTECRVLTRIHHRYFIERSQNYNWHGIFWLLEKKVLRQSHLEFGNLHVDLVSCFPGNVDAGLPTKAVAHPQLGVNSAALAD
jgi:hypothetical protein